MSECLTGFVLSSFFLRVLLLRAFIWSNNALVLVYFIVAMSIVVICRLLLLLWGVSAYWKSSIQIYQIIIKVELHFLVLLLCVFFCLYINVQKNRLGMFCLEPRSLRIHQILQLLYKSLQLVVQFIILEDYIIVTDPINGSLESVRTILTQWSRSNCDKVGNIHQSVCAWSCEFVYCQLFPISKVLLFKCDFLFQSNLMEKLRNVIEIPMCMQEWICLTPYDWERTTENTKWVILQQTWLLSNNRFIQQHYTYHCALMLN